MLRSFEAKICPTHAALIALLDITSTTLICERARSKNWQSFILVFFFKIFSSSTFHTKKFSFLAGAVGVAIEKENQYVAKSNGNYS